MTSNTRERKPDWDSLTDEQLRRGLWRFAPEDRRAVISERRRRFGVNDEEGLAIE